MGVFKNPRKRKEAHDSREIIKSSIKLNELFLIALIMLVSVSEQYIPLIYRIEFIEARGHSFIEFGLSRHSQIRLS
jgi:hypothetical protein